MHGVTKAIELKANGLREWIQEPNGKSSMAVIAETTLNRKDFGLGWNPAIEAGGLTVGEEVAIRLEITWTKA